MQRILWGLIAVAVLALAGWVVAFLAIKKSNDLETRLETSANERTRLGETLATAQAGLEKYRDAAGRMGKLDKRIGAARTKLDRLTRQAETKDREGWALARKIKAGKAELTKLSRKIEADKSQAAGLRQQIQLARMELEKLRAEARQQREAAQRLATQRLAKRPLPRRQRQTTPRPGKTTAPSSAVAKTGTRKRDLTEEARRRYRVIDTNGDDTIDRVEFRLGKVAAFDLIDANGDGYITLDETLLTADKFKRFDANGDGKISSIEVITSRSFDMIDGNGDGSLTFKEYLSFIRETVR
jgi:Ca2+-binding EF-hand superfamily protein